MSRSKKMSESAKRLFGEKPATQEQSSASGLLGFLSQAVSTVSQAMSAVYKAVEPELTEKFKHGAHEASSALFTGNSYVQYGSGSSMSEPTIESALNMGNEQESGRSM
jgi:hypothetical protein